MSLAAGQSLGAYRILDPLGVGGMGEVYRAADSKLGREVAVKVLPATVREDPERLARFQREAQLLAALNHPQIAAIYGLEEAEGKPFLVLELVPGEDLAARLKRGPVPMDEALEIARQTAASRETITSSAKPSHEAPTLGCDSISRAVPRPRRACSNPLSRM